MITSLLIAERGEIAWPFIRTVQPRNVLGLGPAAAIEAGVEEALRFGGFRR